MRALPRRASHGTRATSSCAQLRSTTVTGDSPSRKRCSPSGASGCVRTSWDSRPKTELLGSDPFGVRPRGVFGRPVGHQDRVDVAVAAAVVLLPVALLHEAEALVQCDRRVVPGEDVQLELAHARVARPGDGRAQELGADALAAVRLRDHQAEIGDVPACRMLVTRDRKPADDLAVVVRDVDGSVRIAADRAQVTPFVGGVAPTIRCDEPAFRLAADGVTEVLETLRVTGLGATHDHSTTTPAPPRRGSPAAASSPSSSVTAAAPPKKRLRLRQRATFQPRCSSLSSSAGSCPPSQCRTSSSSRCTRGLPIASSTDKLCATTFTTTCNTAPRRRSEPALPATTCGVPPRSTSDGLIADESRAPGRGFRAMSNSPIMLFMWMPVPGTTIPEPAPVDAVSATALPRPSMTEMCVVPRVTTAPPSSSARSKPRPAGACSCSRITRASASIASAVPGLPTLSSSSSGSP